MYNAYMNLYILPPDGFTIFGYSIKFYGLIMATAMLIGVFLACHLAKKRNVKSDDIFLLALIVLPCSVVGARLYYCIFEGGYTFAELFQIRKGGLAIYGGVIGGIVGIVIFCLIKKNFKLLITLFDICAPCLILGQALGRWGNFFNQEAYGTYISDPRFQFFPFGVYIEDVCHQSGCLCGNQAGMWHLATFFYESIWNLIGFIILILVYYKTKKTGTTTAFYLIWYGLGRTFIEGLRTDSLYLGSTGIRVSQALSAIMVVVGIVILAINIYRRNKTKLKN